MKLIKVTYRNVFKQPIGVLNPMNLKLPGDFPVEVFEAGNRWKIREIASARRQVYEKLGDHINARMATDAAALRFDSHQGEWQMWGIPPGPAICQERIIEPAEVAVITKDGKERVYFREAEDFTHIIHAPTLDPKQRVPAAACGAQVKAETFINNRANVEPTCVKCAQVWREHYQDRKSA